MHSQCSLKISGAAPLHAQDRTTSTLHVRARVSHVYGGWPHDHPHVVTCARRTLQRSHAVAHAPLLTRRPLNSPFTPLARCGTDMQCPLRARLPRGRPWWLPCATRFHLSLMTTSSLAHSAPRPAHPWLPSTAPWASHALVLALAAHPLAPAHCYRAI